MKRYQTRGLSEIVCSFLAFLLLSGAAQAAHHGDQSLLIIRRAPSFGSGSWLQIWIDGRKERMIGKGHDFRTTLSPGHHVITLQKKPGDRIYHPNDWPLDVRSGRTYEFMAFWEKERVFLRALHSHSD